MKKKILKLLMCVTMSAMVLTLGACGSKNDDASDKKVEDTEKKDTAKDGEDNKDNNKDKVKPENDSEADGTDKTQDGAGSSSNDNMFDSIADFAASDEVQSQLTSLKSSLAASGMDVNITGEDNKLIYTYNCSELTKTDELAESLKSQLGKQEATFKAIAKSIKTAVNVENPVVVVTYIDVNGEVIVSQEFPAD